MRFERTIIVFDAADLHAESGFWAGLLDGRVVAEEDWHSIVIDGEWRMAVQLSPNHIAPVWLSVPNSDSRSAEARAAASSNQQIHLDLHLDVKDFPATHERIIALGGKLLQAAEDLSAAEGHQVYADPAGHPFCIGWH